MPSDQKEDLIGKWSLEKLELLSKYLEAYLKILTNQSWCRGFEYIDAFTGTGKPKTTGCYKISVAMTFEKAFSLPSMSPETSLSDNSPFVMLF
jgi:three-Cys-motif partner protein